MKLSMPVPGLVLVTTLAASSVLIATPTDASAAVPRCRGERATVVGTAGSDVLTGTNGRDVIWAGDGQDRISAGRGNDVVCAGPGPDDVLAGNGSDRVLGEGGDDELDSGPGDDDVVDGGAGADTLVAASAGAVLRGGTGSDDLWGNEEEVVLDGGADDDRLLARSAGLHLRGGDGADVIDGWHGRDTDVDGGPGNDEIATGGGMDGRPDRPVTGGAGDDHILVEGSRDFVDGGTGNDLIDLGSGDQGWAIGGGGDDTIASGATTGALLRGDAGDDTLTVTEPGSVADGGAGADTLTGSLWDDVLEGGAGPDVVRSGEGDDILAGGHGDDRLWGEQGTDVCSGGTGHDECDGGPLGTDAPSSEDPDLCRADVEVKRNCRAEDPTWSGSAEGTLAYSGNVVETWSATYGLDPVVDGSVWSGDAAITWRIAGTDRRGCTYDGAATLDGRAGLTIWEPFGTYAHDVHRIAGQTVDVVIDCPDAAPRTEVYQPMNTDAADTDEQPLPEGPVAAVQGTRTYVPANIDDGEVIWTWQLQRGR